ncbi:MAG TPA: histidine kinase [Sediminibacterium sp.]|jgi:two-component system LytT family sensor kinase|nr:histidine kinase [Sediminibacterium sp.]
MHRFLIISIHVLYWIMFILLLMLFYFFLMLLPVNATLEQQNPGRFGFWVRLMFGFAIVPGLIGFYGFYGFLFDRYLSKKKYWLFALMSFVVAIFAAIIGVIVELLPSVFGAKFILRNDIFSMVIILGVMSFGAFVNGIIGLVIRGFISWFNDIKIKESLSQKNFEMELNLIKSQINPHFLFNTLNNIDVLIEKDPPKASLYFNKLSAIMRFMLYETKTDKIPLAKELDYITQYIDLQKIRHANPDFVQYDVEGVVDFISIEPMLFIPFIENAFKHVRFAKDGIGIKIQLQLTDKIIRFSCENSIGSNAIENELYGGLGNGLIVKRLNLLYPQQHELLITKSNQHYLVSLTIQYAD